jgi:nitrous oxidase accessory protein NosD
MMALNREKVLVLAAVLSVLSLLPTVLVISASVQEPFSTVIILPDGSISPSTAPIAQSRNTYTFKDNLYARIIIQKSNIVLNGAGYTLQGPYNGTAANNWIVGNGPNQQINGTFTDYIIGVDFGGKDVDGITVKNLNIRNFSIGIYVWTKNNTITKDNFSDNIVGILVSGSNQTLTDNYIANNQRGLFFGFNNKVTNVVPTDIEVNHNDFEHNMVQLNGCGCESINASEPPHDWDDGREGNFWSDYNGTDSNYDGIGDSPYVIDSLNLDRFPLLQSPVKLPMPAAKVPVDVVVLVVLAAVVVVAALLVRRRNKSHRV